MAYSVELIKDVAVISICRLLPPSMQRYSRYTRNGKLLGDGFVGVHEPHLVPVVGFHSNGESVRVNFGVSPFVYEVSLSTLSFAEKNAHLRTLPRPCR